MHNTTPTYGNPANYQGQPLCRRCGVDADGIVWPDCEHPEHTHNETCARYTFLDEDIHGTDVCDACEARIAAQEGA
mgnify:CR=1 FL=1